MTQRRIWRNQRGNNNPYIEEEQKTQWSKEKGQKDKQRSTKHTHKTKDRITRTPLKTGGELMCSGRVSRSCSTTGTRRVNLVTNPVMCLEKPAIKQQLTHIYSTLITKEVSCINISSYSDCVNLIFLIFILSNISIQLLHWYN